MGRKRYSFSSTSAKGKLCPYCEKRIAGHAYYGHLTICKRNSGVIKDVKPTTTKPNAEPQTTAEEAGVNFDAMTLAQLKDFVKEHGIEITGNKSKKASYIEAIKEHEEAGEAPVVPAEEATDAEDTDTGSEVEEADLSEMTEEQLQDVAGELEIENFHKLSVEELITAIKAKRELAD